MRRIDRRRLLQLSSAGAVAASTGGLATILAARRAPAYAQGSALHWLRWADFVPASDVLLKGEIVKLCEKDLGMKLTVETINANDIQARITAAIQSGSGPDIFMTVNNWPQLYADSCVDVSDVAEDLGKAQGGFYDICTVIGTVAASTNNAGESERTARTPSTMKPITMNANVAKPRYHPNHRNEALW